MDTLMEQVDGLDRICERGEKRSDVSIRDVYFAGTETDHRRGASGVHRFRMDSVRNETNLRANVKYSQPNNNLGRSAL
jgi:hypothetical protein